MNKVTEHELNYAMIYYLNGGLMYEGFLSKWQFDGNNQTVTTWFIDGSVIRTSVNYVFLMHKDYEN